MDLSPRFLSSVHPAIVITAEHSFQERASLERFLAEGLEQLSSAKTKVTDQDVPIEVIRYCPTHESQPPILLLGGMGPAAGLELMRTALKLYEGGRALVLLQLTSVPDRSEAIEEGPKSEKHQRVVSTLAAGLEYLAAERTDVPGCLPVVVGCNTAHHFLDRARSSPSIGPQYRLRFVSLIDTTVDVLTKVGGSVLGLYTSGTRASGMYRNRLRTTEAVKLHEPSPEQQARLMRAIYEGIKAGNLELAAQVGEALFLEFADEFHGKLLLAGCTEVPALIRAVQSQTRNERVRTFIAGLRIVDPVACALACS